MKSKRMTSGRRKEKVTKLLWSFRDRSKVLAQSWRDDMDDTSSAMSMPSPPPPVRETTPPAEYLSSDSTKADIQRNVIDTTHPFLLSPETILSPRADVWCILFLSTCASTASLAMSSPPEERGAVERLALSAMGFSMVVAFVVGVAFRYRPSRNAITKPMGTGGCMTLLPMHMTYEFLAAIAAFFLSLFGAAFTFQSMAVAEMEIWNPNLYFATWISSSLSSYLVADLLTVHDASGVLPRGYSSVMGNAIARGWALLFIASLGLLSFSIALRSAEVCNSTHYGDLTNICHTSALGVVFAILGMILVGGYILLGLDSSLNRQSDVNVNIYGQRASTVSTSSRPSSKKHLISSILAAAALVNYSINAGLVTSPTVLPGASEPCNVYFSSWLCFALSFYICIRSAEVYLVPGSAKEITSLVVVQATTSDEKKSHPRRRRHFRRRRSESTASHSHDSDDYDAEEIDETNYGVQDIDEGLASMVESRSEDGPMLFQDDNGIEDDVSYPSMTPKNNNYMGFIRDGFAAHPFEPPQGRDPEKPMPVDPSVCPVATRYAPAPSILASLVAGGGANTRSRPQMEPPAGFPSDDSTLRTAKDPPTIGGIDVKSPANDSSGSSERSRSISSKSSRRGRSRSRGRSHIDISIAESVSESDKSQNPAELYPPPPREFAASAAVLQSTPQSPAKTFSMSDNMLCQGRKNYSFAAPPLTQQQTLRPPPPPRRAPERDLFQAKPTETENLEVTEADIELAQTSFFGLTTPAESKGAISTKSKCSKSSSRVSKSRSRSRGATAKRRSASREGDKTPTKSPTRNKYPTPKRNSAKTGASPLSPSTANSSGPPGQGPPTMSASGGSVPLTVEEEEPVAMGRVGPKEVPSPVESDDGRPVDTVIGSSNSTCTDVSEPTLEGFRPVEEEVNEDPKMRFSIADLSTASSQTEENNALRKGAVDQMVMEALRQAQETRYENKKEKKNSSSARKVGRRVSNPQAHSDLSSSVPSASVPSLRSSLIAASGKSPHGLRKSLTSKQATSMRPLPRGMNSSGGGDRKGGKAVESLTSGFSSSEPTNFDNGSHAYAC